MIPAYCFHSFHFKLKTKVFFYSWVLWVCDSCVPFHHIWFLSYVLVNTFFSLLAIQIMGQGSRTLKLGPRQIGHKAVLAYLHLQHSKCREHSLMQWFMCHDTIIHSTMCALTFFLNIQNSNHFPLYFHSISLVSICCYLAPTSWDVHNIRHSKCSTLLWTQVQKLRSGRPGRYRTWSVPCL